MITAQKWWEGLSNYNEAIFPIQILVMVIVLMFTLLIRFKPSKLTSDLMKGLLSISMLFNGIMFFMILGDKLPAPLKYIQGGLFIIIGITFAIDIITNQSTLSFPPKGIKRNIAYALLIIVALYPIVGLMRGHNVSQLIYPCTVPCGSTAFALTILSASLPKVNKKTYILLLIWAIPFAPLIQIPQFKVYEDSIMFIIGIYSLVMLIRTFRLKKRNKLEQL